MTTIEQRNEICCLCGTENSVSVLTSSDPDGASDLDTRPSGKFRSSMFSWIHRCSRCGYVAADLSKKFPKAVETIQSPAYRAQLEDSHFSELADQFLCLSLIQEATGQIEPAAWSALEAAWDCDDEQNLTGSLFCRLRALELFERLPEDRSATLYAVLADLYRRTGQFQLASSACQQGMEAGPDDLLKKVLKFQAELIEDQDDSCHSLREIK